MDIKFAALLPMKEHSERINNKNFRDFCGKPLFSYILDTLLCCGFVSDVYVDTDSRILADLVKGFSPKVHIIARPEGLCGDMVSMNDIIAYDIEQTGEDYFIQTHTTNPLLKKETLETAYKKFVSGVGIYDSLFSVNCIYARLYDKNVCPVNHDPKKLMRTQDLEPLYEENSNFYFFTKESFQKSHARIGRSPQVFLMDKLESADIDEEADFILAEQIYRMVKNLK